MKIIPKLSLNYPPCLLHCSVMLLMARLVSLVVVVVFLPSQGIYRNEEGTGKITEEF